MPCDSWLNQILNLSLNGKCIYIVHILPHPLAFGVLRSFHNQRPDSCGFRIAIGQTRLLTSVKYCRSCKSNHGPYTAIMPMYLNNNCHATNGLPMISSLECRVEYAKYHCHVCIGGHPDL